ncbi:MAG TPA: NAD(P)-binding domain-containing protein, partial [Acidimicrobiia bacterium]
MNLALLGGGRMGEALAAGLLKAGWEASAIAIAEIDSDRRHLLEERLAGVRVVPSPAWAATDAAVVVVAVKPDDVA